MTKIVTYSETTAKTYINSGNCVSFTRIKGKYTIYLK